MILLPAIDLYDKKAVRLYKGDYENMTVYSDDPLSVARDFEACGAKYVHMVDLEGAKNGTTPNLEIVAQVAKETNLFVEIGGGIRTMETLDTYMAAGVGRAILGTAAIKDEAFLKAAVAKYPGKIAVGADVRDGYIALSGWLESSGIRLEDFLARMCKLGVDTVICTDISRDGAMRGTNLALYRALKKSYPIHIIASGGVSSLEDVIALRTMDLYGAIIGKAYYTGAIDLAQALEVAK